MLSALALGPAQVASAQTTPPSDAATQPSAGVVNAYRVAARARAALDLLRAGQPQAAGTQLDKAASGPLDDAGHAQRQLTSALTRLRNAVGDDDVPAASSAADAAASAARALGVGEGTDPAALVAALVRDATSEGQEAAQAAAAEATEPRAYALALCALATDVARRQDLASTARQAIATLNAGIGNRAGEDAVAAAGATALAALGAPPSAEEAAQAFDAIDHDLTLAVTRYRQGDAAGAQEALVSAYLDHFEGLEPALRKVDPALEQDLETTLAQRLRQLVRDGAPAARFADAVSEARIGLQKAREALT